MDHEVDIKAITQVVTSIQRVVADFYGPQCSQTLMTSSTGKAVITSDGMTILEALHPEHPVANLVLQAIKSCHSVTLDGSKLFLLYLGNILTHLQQEIDQASFQHGGTNLKLDNTSQRRQSSICVRKCLQQVLTGVMPKLTQQVLDHCKSVNVEIVNRNISSQELMKNIIKTTLMPHYSVKQCEFYSQLLISSLPVDEPYHTLVESLQLMVDKFYSIIIKVANRPYTDCAAFTTHLICRTFKVKHQDVLSRSKLLAVMLNYENNFISTEDERITTNLVIKKSCTIGNMLDAKRQVVESFAKECVRKNVNIVLCTGSIPNYAVDIFNRHDISVVLNMVEDDIEILQISSGKVVVTDLAEDIEYIHIVSLSEVSEVIVGGRQYLLMRLEKGLKFLKHLIVCAPTVGLCDQLAGNLLKALNALKLSMKPEIDSGIASSIWSKESYIKNTRSTKHNKSDEEVIADNLRKMKLSSTKENGDLQNADTRKNFAVIEGGTSFEILLGNMFDHFIKDCSDPNIATVCKVLSRTMYAVVKKLYNNTNMEPSKKHNFIVVEALLKEKASSGCLWGLNRRGIPCSLLDSSMMEPVILKIHTLNCVLSLINQLLSVDKIVSVKKIKDDEE